MTDGTCSLPDCGRPTSVRGWCPPHYQKWLRHGTPLGGKPLRRQRTVGLSSADRFWKHVDKTGNCWLWTACKSQGYGRFRVDGKTVLAHRYAYELLIGHPVPDVLDHDRRCPKNCVNPFPHWPNSPGLRGVSIKQNLENHNGPYRNSTSGVRGVSWDKNRGKWKAAISNQGKSFYIGRFGLLAEANVAAIAARLRLHTHNDADRASPL